MKKKICILLLIAFATAICGCSTGPSVDELQSEIEMIKEENEMLKRERNMALANAYMLHKLLENRSGENYLEKNIKGYKAINGYDYCYYDYMSDFVSDYADNGYDDLLYEEGLGAYGIAKLVESTYPLSTFDPDSSHLWK